MLGFILRIPKKILAYLYKGRFGSVGINFKFDPISSRFRGAKNIYIGNRVFIGYGAQFSVTEKLTIGDDVLIGPQVMILSGNHRIDEIGFNINDFDEGINGRCIIGRDVWIGARTIIIGDIRIGDGAVIGAGSIVTRSIPSYTVAVGTPCRVIRERFSDQDLRQHLEVLGRSGEYDQILSERKRN